ncbi:NAD(P)H-dependent oxidoreductase [Ferrimonas balearica]|uniref:NAD(P)H-dependent oxidoreductase n=1 Tax=Ferrimonas balearica TaxID=44012 RepID=UPI001F31F526|nr:NAD(P)H-dependent oxidoreductase [Ferrimonas balearica]MBY6093299.1 NAD(P)H-dependent oxidoreductase [Ferrimonas balearica]
MSRIVVISGHPNLEQSYTNRLILARLHQRDDVSVRDLATLYPDSRIDVAAEQAALLAAEVVVLQFPFYWYSVPGIMKQWMDDVLTYGFAYGSTGDKLKGKKLVVSTTVGGPDESYQAGGYNQYTMEQLLFPLHQLSTLTQMDWQSPVISHGMVFIPGVYNTQELVESRAEQHVERLLAELEGRLPSAPVVELMQQWFAMLDQLPADPEVYLPFMADNVVFEVPEGRFEGHAGFVRWYDALLGQFQPGLSHRIEQVSAAQTETGYCTLAFTVTVSGTSTGGEPVSLTVQERWQLVEQDGVLQIQHYQVRLP